MNLHHPWISATPATTFSDPWVGMDPMRIGTDHGQTRFRLKGLASGDLATLSASFDHLPSADAFGGVGGSRMVLGRYCLDRPGEPTWMPPISPNMYHALTSLSVELDPDGGGRFATFASMDATTALGPALGKTIRLALAQVPINKAIRSVDVYQARFSVGSILPGSHPLFGPARAMALMLIARRETMTVARREGHVLQRPLDVMAWHGPVVSPDLATAASTTLASGFCDVLLLTFRG
jgi:hypothetical protein